MQSQAGVTLLEALIFMTILSVIMLAIVYATTISLKRTQFNQHKIFATRYMEEAQEWVRGEKEVNWTIFLNRAPGTYCMNDDISTCSEAGTCWSEPTACEATDYSLGSTGGIQNGYSRSIVLTSTGSSVGAVTTVSWKDGPNIFNVTSNTSFSRWE